MRGSITLAESYLLDSESRTLICEIIEDNLNITKDTGLPFF